MSKPSRVQKIEDLCNPPPRRRREQGQTNQTPNPMSNPEQYRQDSSTIRTSSSFHTHSVQHPQGRESAQLRLPSINEVLSSTNMSDMGRYQPSTDCHTSQLQEVPERRNSISQSGPQCDICGRSFTRRADVIKHVRVVHDRVKNFVCEICGRRFGRKDYLTKHKKALHGKHSSGASGSSTKQ